MSNYVFIYYGEPKFESRDDGAKYQDRWRSWVSGIGDAWVNPGTPFGTPKTVSAAGVTDSSATTASGRVTGFSVVKADNLDAALAMAQACPHLEHGTVDVAEAYDM
jgi:hypothetical protein